MNYIYHNQHTFYEYMERNKYIQYYILLTQIYICIPESLKINVSNNLLNLCSRVVNSQTLFCSQKSGVKVRIKAIWYTINVITFFYYIIHQYSYQ